MNAIHGYAIARNGTNPGKAWHQRETCWVVVQVKENHQGRSIGLTEAQIRARGLRPCRHCCPTSQRTGTNKAP